MVTRMWIGGYRSDSRDDYDSDGTRRGLWGISGGHARYGSGWLLGTCSDGLGDSNWEAELVVVLSVRSTCYGNSRNERCHGGSSFPPSFTHSLNSAPAWGELCRRAKVSERDGWH